MKLKTIKGECCSDCLLMIANGDLPEDCSEERQKELEAISTEWVLCGAASEPIEFSWRSCDVCGSALGGSRHAVCFIERQD